MKYPTAIALTFTIISSPAVADNTDLERNLGSVLGSETACGLTYDQDAIRSFIVKNADANDMSFARNVASYTAGTKFEIEKMMSASSLTAHCTQIRRVAKQYGFIK